MIRTGVGMSIKCRRQAKGQAQKAYLWQHMANKRNFQDRENDRNHRCNPANRRDIWHKYEQAKRSNTRFNLEGNIIRIMALKGINGSNTTTSLNQSMRSMGNRMKIVYLFDSISYGFDVIYLESLANWCINWAPSHKQGKSCGGIMESGSRRSINANRELHTAQKMYEMRTTAKNKRKIANLETSVKEEAS